MSNIGHNNPPVDHAAIVAANAPEAARDMARGNIRLRLMATAMLNLCMNGADSATVKLNAERAAGIVKGDKVVRPTVDGVKYTLTADESAKVKAAFATMFSHVAWFKGELTADDVAADVTAMRDGVLSGTVALSTAYKALTTARNKAAKDATAKAEAAEGAEAEAALTSQVGPKEEPSPADILGRIAVDVLALAERIANAPPATDASGEAVAAAIALLVEAWNAAPVILADDAATGTNG